MQPQSPCPIEATYQHLITNTAGHPSSHASNHAIRVHNIAVKLTKSLSPPPHLLTVRIAALLHDIYDPKVNPICNASPLARSRLTNFLTSLSLEPSIIQNIVFIVERASYSSQIQNPIAPHLRTIELDVVQDADRLEAIGALGVARCFSFGGEADRPIEFSRCHFNDKLLKLMSLMKTGPGKKIAEHRHAFMQSFLRQLDSEYAFAGQQSWSHEVIGIRSLEEP